MSIYTSDLITFLATLKYTGAYQQVLVVNSKLTLLISRQRMESFKTPTTVLGEKLINVLYIVAINYSRLITGVIR